MTAETKQVVRWSEVACDGADPDGGLNRYSGTYTAERPRCAAALAKPWVPEKYRSEPWLWWRQCRSASSPGHEFCASHGGPPMRPQDPAKAEIKRRHRERKKREREIASLARSYRRAPDPLSVVLLAGVIDWES